MYLSSVVGPGAEDDPLASHSLQVERALTFRQWAHENVGAFTR
ncbi:hypothetical protein [Kitasatospora atroaurantiaca]|nr:hypothetical protein [Kitasatospora atroaurantiaca]